MAGDGVVLLVLMLDLRRRRLNIFFRIFLPVVMIDPDVSESVLSDELESSEDDEEFIISCKNPGCDSSSMTFCGVLSYMYAWDLSWNSR